MQRFSTRQASSETVKSLKLHRFSTERKIFLRLLSLNYSRLVIVLSARSRNVVLRICGAEYGTCAGGAEISDCHIVANFRNINLGNIRKFMLQHEHYLPNANFMLKYLWFRFYREIISSGYQIMLWNLWNSQEYYFFFSWKSFLGNIFWILHAGCWINFTHFSRNVIEINFR